MAFKLSSIAKPMSVWVGSINPSRPIDWVLQKPTERHQHNFRLLRRASVFLHLPSGISPIPHFCHMPQRLISSGIDAPSANARCSSDAMRGTLLGELFQRATPECNDADGKSIG